MENREDWENGENWKIMKFQTKKENKGNRGKCGKYGKWRKWGRLWIWGKTKGKIQKSRIKNLIRKIGKKIKENKKCVNVKNWM